MVHLLWKSLAAPRNVLRRVTIGPRNPTPRYIPRSEKNRRPHKNLYVNVHRSIIPNSQKRGNHLNAHQLMSGQRGGLATQWSVTCQGEETNTDSHCNRDAPRTLCRVRRSSPERPHVV